MAKSTISMDMFNSKLLVYLRVYPLQTLRKVNEATYLTKADESQFPTQKSMGD